MIQLFMSRSGSSAIVPLQFPASQSAIAEASRQLDEASREGKTKIVEIKSVIANLPSYLSRLDPDSRTQLAQLNRLSSIIAQMDSRERNIYAGALDGNSINDLNDVIRVAEQVSDYILIPNINSDVTLGRYVAVAGQIQGDPRFPEAAWPYPENLKAKPMLWLWELRDIGIIGVGFLLSVLALSQGAGMIPLVITVLFSFLTIRVDGSSILDFLRRAACFLILQQQYYEWRLDP